MAEDPVEGWRPAPPYLRFVSTYLDGDVQTHSTKKRIGGPTRGLDRDPKGKGPHVPRYQDGSDPQVTGTWTTSRPKGVSYPIHGSCVTPSLGGVTIRVPLYAHGERKETEE